MLTPEQLEERRKGITATDVAKIVGQSPYGCGEDVRLDKMGAGLPFVEHDRVKWGNLLEDPIRKDYEKRHRVAVRSGDEIGTLRHPTNPWALATPDGLIYDVDRFAADLAAGNAVRGAPEWGHEIKTHTSWLSHLYGEPGTDQVPGWELIQCAWNIWVCSSFYGVELDRWDLTVFLDGLPTDYTIMRDEQLETALVEACRQFWDVHVVGGEPVPPDGSENYGEILKSRYPKHKENLIIELGPGQLDLVNGLKEARAARKQWETEEERIAQEIKSMMGDAASLQWIEEINGKEKPQRINWKLANPTRKTGWKALAQEYRGILESLGEDPDDLNDVASNFEKETPGSRRFTVPRSWSAK